MPDAPATPAPTTPGTEPATPPADPQAPAAAAPAPATPAKKTLEDSLAALDEDTRNYVLGEVRTARTEAQNLRARVKEAEPILQQWQQLEEASKTELEKAQEAASSAAERAKSLVDRAVKAEIKALASTFADPSDAHAFLDTSKYANEAGEIDTEAIETDLADLLQRKPHLAKSEGMRPNPAQGATSGAAAPPIDTQIAEAEKAGDHLRAIALKQQRAAELRAKKA